MKKWITSILLMLALVLLCAVIPMQAQASTVDSGSCGENITWTLDDSGVLTISGTGAMADYASASAAPWYSSRSNITKVVIENGITTIGDRAFYNATP